MQTEKKLENHNNFSLKLNEIKTIEELKRTVENFNKCKLKNSSKNTVFSDGNPKARLMLIGEAPGAEEDKIG